MNKIRISIAIFGILLPYLARLPGGFLWVEQYMDTGLDGYLFFGAFNAIAWGSIIVISLLYRHPMPLLLPCVPGFGFLAWAHYGVDLTSDAQASFELLIIPFIALFPILLGGAAGYIWDRQLRKAPKG